MKTHFEIGDVVTSLANAQNMRKGDVFVVLDFGKRHTAFGIFVEYTLKGSDENIIIVNNGHLLLKKLEK